MISAYVGKPGHGKSYGVIENVILPALRSGRKVWSNIPVTDVLLSEFEDLYHCYDISDLEVDSKGVGRGERWFQDVLPPGVVFVLDEAWRIFPSGLRQSAMCKGHQEFLSMHRHYVADGFSTEVVMIVQDLSMMSATVRGLVDMTYRAVRLDHVGSNRRFRIDIYQGSVTGERPPESKRVRQILDGKFNESIYKYYKTSTLTDQIGTDIRTDSRSNGLLSLKKYAYIAAFLIFVVIYGLANFSFTQNKDQKNNNNNEVSAYEPDISNDIRSDNDKLQAYKSMPVEKTNIYADYRFYIVYNNMPDIVIRGESSDSYFDLSIEQISKIGFSAVVISQCLVIVTFQAVDFPVSCQRDTSQDWADTFISGPDSGVPAS
jgi:zona occludens toxin